MKQLPFKKISLLGLVLVAASAVTATMLPKAYSSGGRKFVGNGSIRISGDGFSPTCTSNPADPIPDCFDTDSLGIDSPPYSDTSFLYLTSFDVETINWEPFYIDNGNTTEGDYIL